MRINDKKMFIRGLVFLLMAIVIVVARLFVFTEAHGVLRAVIGVGICLLASVYHLVMALHIDGEDEEGENKR